MITIPPGKYRRNLITLKENSRYTSLSSSLSSLNHHQVPHELVPLDGNGPAHHLQPENGKRGTTNGAQGARLLALPRILFLIHRSLPRPGYPLADRVAKSNKKFRTTKKVILETHVHTCENCVQLRQLCSIRTDRN